MTVRSIIKVTERYVINNSPTLLSAVAVTGAVAAAYLTGKATFRAASILQKEVYDRNMRELDEDDIPTTKECIKLVWKEYIPPAAVLTGTVVCIVTANSISASRMAGLMAAYKVSEKQFNEYRDKVMEKIGPNKEQEVRDEINQEAVRRNPPNDDLHFLAELDDVLFLEKWTGRYFKSKVETVKAAMNTINYRMMSDRYATLSDFYDEIGLKNTQESGEIGWSIENPVDLYFTTTMADGGSRPCIVMEYHNRPIMVRDYTSYNGIH